MRTPSISPAGVLKGGIRLRGRRSSGRRRRSTQRTAASGKLRCGFLVTAYLADEGSAPTATLSGRGQRRIEGTDGGEASVGGFADVGKPRQRRRKVRTFPSAGNPPRPFPSSGMDA